MTPILTPPGFSFGRRLPLILQTEATECGLACLAMIAGYHGDRTGLAALRAHHPVSLKGATLAHLIGTAAHMALETRALKLELEELSQLRMPCILHWNFNHFVVLKSVNAKTITIHDPSCGERTLAITEASKAFTGVALEVWPAPGFTPKIPPPSVSLRSLMGHIHGMLGACGQILALAFALEVMALTSPLFLQWVMDHVLVTGDRDLLTTLAIGFGLLMVFQQVISGMRSWMLMYLSATLNVQWRANVFSHLVRLPMQYFEKRHLGDVLGRFNAVDQIQHTLSSAFLEAVLDGVMTAVTLAMMFLYSPALGAIAVGTMLLYGLGRWAWYRPLRSATEEQIIHAAKQQSHFLETLRGIKAIKLFQRHDARRAAWLTLLVEQINADVRTQKMQLLYRMLNGFLFSAANILIIWLGATQVLDGAFTVGVLMAFNAYKNQFDTRVAALIDKLFELRMLRLQAERLADIVLTAPEAAAAPALPCALPAPGSVTVSGLHFRYSVQEAPVLKGIDLHVAAGESVAIVGPSGCGKSTLLNLLLGILQPEAGSVAIGGVDLQRLGIDRLRGMIGTVLQDDVLFAGSIADNISFFDPGADPAWVAECAAMAAMTDEINAMPMGYNTLVGDMGTVLSGGQKQRILLARALYRRPAILFLDEATSHLDVAKEYEVNTLVKSLNMTRIVIAHRPETIASADRVVVLQEGRIVQDTSVLAHAAPANPVQLIHSKSSHTT